MSDKLSIFCIVAFAIVLYKCVLEPEPTVSSTTTLDNYSKKVIWVDKGKELVKYRLKDPASAQFRNVYFIRARVGGAPTTCGEVNAKNSFGSMTGFRRFLSAGRLEFTLIEGDNADFEEIWTGMCNGTDKTPM